MKQFAIDHEAFFFKGFGLPHEATSASRQYDAVIKGLREQLQSIEAPQCHISRFMPVHPQSTLIAGLIEVPGVS